MSDSGTAKLASWVLLSGLLCVIGMAEGVYASQGGQPSDRFRLVATLGLMPLLWYWFVRQLDPHRPTFPMDMGVFLSALWFILIPYYFWRYERWRGVRKMIGLLGVYLLSWAVNLFVFLLLR